MSKPIKRPLMSFCPKCETILRKKIEPNAVVLMCRNCGYRQVIEERSSQKQSLASSGSVKREKIIKSKPDSSLTTKKSGEKHNHSEKAQHSSEADEEDILKKTEQEILLSEIKKNNFLKLLDGFSGPKKSEMIIEVLYLLQRVQELKWVYEFYKSTSAETEAPIVAQNDPNPSDSPTLIDASKKSEIWISTLQEKLSAFHPEFNSKKTKYWLNFETEIERFNIAFIYPDKNDLFLITRTSGVHKDKLAPLLFKLNSEDDVEGALTAIHKSNETVQQFLQRWSAGP